MKFKILLYPILCLTFLLVGCEQLQGFFDSNAGVYDSLVRLATSETIKGDSKRAQDLADLASFTKELASESSTAVTQIDKQLAIYINSKDWDQYRKDVYFELVELIKTYIRQKIDEGVLDSDYTVLISHTADLVLQVTSRY